MEQHAISPSEGQSIIIAFVGDWRRHMNIHTDILLGIHDHMEFIQSPKRFHFAETAKELEAFFTVGIPSADWRIVYKMPIEEFQSVKTMGSVFSHYTKNVFAITLDEKFIKGSSGLFAAGYRRIISLTQSDLKDPKSLFQAIFNRALVPECLT